MNKAKLNWQERASESMFVASVWSCSTSVATTRAVLADPCISITLIKEGEHKRVVLRGPETKPRNELLASGYTGIAIRLRPGVLLKGFSTQQFINSSSIIPADAESRFWFEGTHLQFPDYNGAESLIKQLYHVGAIDYNPSNNEPIQADEALSSRSYSRLIKRNTGLTPYRLYQLQRMHQALRLIKQGVTAATVATELNFVDQAHLTHTSKRLLGHTPKQLTRLPQLP